MPRAYLGRYLSPYDAAHGWGYTAAGLSGITRFMRQLSYRWAVLLLAGLAAAAAADEDDYMEPGWFQYQEKPARPEAAVVLPPYPDLRNSIEVETGIRDFPFTLLIDPASLSIDGRQVVRYTVILQSRGATNVFYEAVRCSDRHYRRYAYGVAGVFKPLASSGWEPVQRAINRRYREVLLQHYLCPLPARKAVPQLIRRLRSDRATELSSEQEE